MDQRQPAAYRVVYDISGGTLSFSGLTIPYRGIAKRWIVGSNKWSFFPACDKRRNTTREVSKRIAGTSARPVKGTAALPSA